MSVDAFSSQQLATLFNVTRQAIEKRAIKEGWQSKKRMGQGGGKVWLAKFFPPETKAQVASALVNSQTESCAKGSDVPLKSPQGEVLAGLGERERTIASARLMFAREIDRLSAAIGKEMAIRHLVESSRLHTLPQHLAGMIAVANACPEPTTTLSRRTLYRWHEAYLNGGIAALAPSQGRTSPAPEWGAEFLACYQKPQNPTVAAAYDDFCKTYSGEAPSIYAIRRYLKKMTLLEKEVGRVTGNALLKLRPYKRRSTAELWPTDIYTADGTTFDAEVLHPYHGQPFRPELTAVLDVATRRCVGLSINLSESALTILDATRMACLFGGIPAMFYSDNGSGYSNALMKDESLGMFARLGIEAVNSIPGRPQGKGLMERAVKTLWVRCAQELESYVGAYMDDDTARRNFRASRSAIKRGKRAYLPTWEEFKAHVLKRVEQYNNTPHRGLPFFKDAEGRKRHYTPNGYWQSFVERGFTPVTVPDGLGDELFMPAEKRQVRNGWIQFYNGEYYARELADWHQQYVEVRYDIWDSSKIQVWKPGGHKICTALIDGNTIPYFPQSRIEAAREKRTHAQVKRLDDKLQRIAPGAEIILPERQERPLELADSTRQGVVVEIPARPDPDPAKDARPRIFAHSYQRYRWLMAHREQWTDKDRDWLRKYAATEEYQDMAELYAVEGIDWRQQ